MKLLLLSVLKQRTLLQEFLIKSYLVYVSFLVVTRRNLHTREP